MKILVLAIAALILNPEIDNYKEFNVDEALRCSGNNYRNLTEKIDFYSSLIDEINLTPNHLAYFHHCRGISYFLMERNEEALKDFDTTISYYPEYANAYTNIGNIYYRLHDYEKAFEFYDKGIQLNPDYSVPYHNVGIMYLDVKNLQKAFEYFNLALDKDPDNLSALNYRATIYKDIGQPDKALSDLDTVLLKDSSYVFAYANRSLVYSNIGMFKEALNDANKALQLHPANIEFLVNKANILHSNGRMEEAITEYNNALLADPDSGQIYTVRGITYARLGNLEQAINDLKHAVELSYPIANQFLIAAQKGLATFLLPNKYQNNIKLTSVSFSTHYDQTTDQDMLYLLPNSYRFDYVCLDKEGQKKKKYEILETKENITYRFFEKYTADGDCFIEIQ